MFIDYYSILNISFPSNGEEINTAYTAKKEALGEGSKNNNNPNYLMRVNIELAYRILGVSYALKTAYDEEYLNAIAKGFDTYEIQDDWLQSSIERERNFVVNKMKCPNIMNTLSIPQKRDETWGMKVFGCLGRLFILLFVFQAINIIVRECQREKVKSSLLSTTGKYIREEELEGLMNEFVVETAEHELNYLAMVKNIRLPEKMNDSIICKSVLIENDALVYVYDIDDTYFSEIKDNLLSKNAQLQKLKSLDEEMEPMINTLIATHRGICWRIICRKSGEIAECKIDYSDLVNLK